LIQPEWKTGLGGAHTCRILMYPLASSLALPSGDILMKHHQQALVRSFNTNKEARSGYLIALVDNAINAMQK
jgi:hypothetical protein